MARTRLFWRLYPPFAVAVVGAVTAIAIAAAVVARDAHIQGRHDAMAAQLAMASTAMQPLVLDDLKTPSPETAAALDKRVRRFSLQSGMRLSAVALDGRILADSRADFPDVNPDAPGLRDAFEGGIGRTTRFSRLWQETARVVAVPIVDGEYVVAAIEGSMPESALAGGLQPVREKLALVALAVALLVLVAGLFVPRIVQKPLLRMRQKAQLLARGDLTSRLPVPPIEEMGEIAEAVNRMAAELDTRIGALAKQRHEQQAVFASMVEGVLAVDTDERLLSLNHAAARFLDTEPGRAIGRSIFEVIRNASLQRFVRLALSSESPVEDDITLHDAELKFLQLHGTVLRDSMGRGVGAVIVFNDVTRLRKLETLRRDFVANVSHELRTPITSIKGFAETLLDGALDDREDAERFLNIIVRHADRLHAIIEDLLSLSRIESSSETGGLELDDVRLETVVNEAVGISGARAPSHRIDVRSDAELVAPVNARLLEQAIVNLLDNAIKYSPAGGPVSVSVARVVDAADLAMAWAEIRVRDQGVGIAAEHLPRLFERFYRVDKGRSRQIGGTGLGLAIVKHIVQAHGGSVRVESEPGVGSTFILRVPLVRKNRTNGRSGSKVVP